MNHLSLPSRAIGDDEQHLLSAALDPRTRLSPVDRLSLRLGLWLLLRGARRLQRRRRPAIPDRTLDRAQADRELRDAWARLTYPHFP